MTHAQYVAYFKELAEQHVVLLHDDATKHSFFRANIEELIEGLPGSKISFPCMALDAQGGQLFGQNSFFDGQWDNVASAFTILYKVTQGDYDDENEKLDLAKTIGFDIIARMYNDFKTKAAWEDGSLKLYYFNPNTVRYYKVGPLNDQEYGYRFEFIIGSPMRVDFGYDGLRWGV